MKRYLLIISALLVINPVLAKNIKVEALSDFSTANPPTTWSIKIAETAVTKQGFVLYSGSIIDGNIEDVTSPKRLKRDASFKFNPTHYYDSKTGQSYTIKRNFVGKYSAVANINAKDVAKDGAIFVGNQVCNGFLGPGIGLAEGLIKNEQGNRAKSAVVSVYERTPLSYANKGDDIEFKKGQIFSMSFKEIEDNKPNYSYQEN